MIFAARFTIALAALVALLACLWGLDRGFDITDEAYYVLLAMHPRDVTLYVSAQQWTSAPLWALTGTLASFRGAGLALLAGSAALLAAGLVSACRGAGIDAFARRGERVAVLAATLTGALLYAATINLSPCYNLMASAGAYAAAGAVLFALHGERRRAPWLLLAGAALGVEFVNKPSAGVATAGLLALGVFALMPAPRAQRVGWIAAMGAAMLAFVLLLALSQTSVGEARTALQEGLALFRMVQTEPVGERLLRYASEFGTLARQSLWFFGASFAFALAWLATRWRVFAFATFVAAVLAYAFGERWMGGADRYVEIVGAAFAMLPLVALVSLPAWRARRGAGVLLAGLWLLPYTVAVGTGNSIFTQVIDSLAPWGAALALMAQISTRLPRGTSLATALAAVAIAGIAAQIVVSQQRAPYHLAEPLAEQGFPVAVGNLGTLKLDPQTAQFVRELDAAAARCRIEAGTPYLGLYHGPGLALALQVRPIATPWLNNVAQADAVLAHAPLRDDRPLLVAVLLDAADARPPLPRALADFPNGYRACGEARYPVTRQRVELWLRDPVPAGATQRERSNGNTST